MLEAVTGVVGVPLLYKTAIFPFFRSKFRGQHLFPKVKVCSIYAFCYVTRGWMRAFQELCRVTETTAARLHSPAWRLSPGAFYRLGLSFIPLTFTRKLSKLGFHSFSPSLHPECIHHAESFSSLALLLFILHLISSS
jgi:hypothetical protein